MSRKLIAIMVVVLMLFQGVGVNFALDLPTGVAVTKIIFAREHAGFTTTGAYLEITGENLHQANILFGRSGQGGGLQDMGERVFNFPNLVKYVLEPDEARNFNGVLNIDGQYIDLDIGSFPAVTGSNQQNINIDDQDDLILEGNNFDSIDGISIVGEFGVAQTTDIDYDPGSGDTPTRITLEDIYPPGEKGFQNIYFSKVDNASDPKIEVNYVYANAFRFVEDLDVTDPILFPNTGAKGDDVFITADDFTDSKNYAVYFLKDIQGGDAYSDVNKATTVSLALDVEGAQDKLTVQVPDHPDFELRNYFVVLTEEVNNEVVSEKVIYNIDSGLPEEFTVVGASFVPTIEEIYPSQGPDTGSSVQLQGRNLVSLNIPDLAADGDFKSPIVGTDGDRKITMYYNDGTYKGQNVTIERSITTQIGKRVFFERDNTNAFKIIKGVPDSIFVYTDVIDDAETDPFKDVIIEIETVLRETGGTGKVYTFRQIATRENGYEFVPSSLTPFVSEVVPETIQVDSDSDRLKETVNLVLKGSNFLVNKYTDAVGDVHVNYPIVLIKTNNDLNPENYDIRIDYNVFNPVTGDRGLAYDRNGLLLDDNGDPVSVSLEVIDTADNALVDGTEGNEAGDKITLTLPKQAELNVLGKKHIQVINPKRSSDEVGKSYLAIDSITFLKTADIPVIESVSPRIVTVEGGEIVKVLGYNFQEGVVVYIDGEEVAGVTREIDIQGSKIILSFPAPPGREGTTQLQILNPSGGIAVSDFFYVTTFEKDPIIYDFSPAIGTYNTLVLINGDNYLRPDPTVGSKVGLSALRLIGTRVYLDGDDINTYNFDTAGDYAFIPYTSPDEEPFLSVLNSSIQVSPFKENIVIEDEGGKIFYLENDENRNPVFTDREFYRYTVTYNAVAGTYQGIDADGNVMAATVSSLNDVTTVTMGAKTFTITMNNQVFLPKKDGDGLPYAAAADYAESIILEDGNGGFYVIYVNADDQIILTNGKNNSYQVVYKNGGFVAIKDAGGEFDITVNDAGITIDESPNIDLTYSTVYEIDPDNDRIIGDRTKVVSRQQVQFFVPKLSTGRGYKDLAIVNPDTKIALKEDEEGFFYINQASTYPVISTVVPGKGSTDGGYAVVITGKDFEDNMQVYVDSVKVPAEDTNVALDGKSVTIRMPASIKDLANDYGVDALYVPIVVMNQDGGNDYKEKGFQYLIPTSNPSIQQIIPTGGSASGGEIVEIIGYEFRFFEPYKDVVGGPEYDFGDEFEDIYPNNQWDDILANSYDPGAVTSLPLGTNLYYDTYYSSPILPKVYFGNREAKIVEYAKGYLKVITPTGAAGTVDVYVLNNDSGTSNMVPYTYKTSQPRITQVNPNIGSILGLEKRDIYGSDFFQATLEGYADDDETTIVPLTDVNGLVRFGNITNKNIDRFLPNSGLINNQRAEVNLEGDLKVIYRGDQDELTMAIEANGKVYQRTFENYDDREVFLPLEMLQSSGQYFRPNAFSKDNGESYEDFVFEYVRVYVEDRRLMVERGYAPKVEYDSKTHFVVTVPSYHTVADVQLYVINPDGGSGSYPFSYKFPDSEPKIFEIKPATYNAVDIEWDTEGTYEGGIQIEIRGVDFRDNISVKIGPFTAEIIETTTALVEVDGTEVNLDVLIVEVPPAPESSIDIKYPVIVTNPDGGTANSSSIIDLLGDDNDIPYYFIYRKPLSGPVIEAVEPEQTSIYGGNTVTLRGTDFREGAIVIIGSRGGVPISNTVVTDRGKTLTFVTPDTMTLGSKDIQVINPDFGTGTRPGAIEVISDPSVEDVVYQEDGLTPVEWVSVEGDEVITLKGEGFIEGAKVYFGGTRVREELTSTTGVRGLYRDDKWYVLLDSVPAAEVEFVDENTLKVTTPVINEEKEFSIVVVNPDEGMSLDNASVLYSVPKPKAPTELDVLLIDDRYFKLKGYETENTDYYEVYYYIGDQVPSKLIANEYEDFSYLVTTATAEYRITKFPQFDQLDPGENIYFAVKAVNKFGASSWSNIAYLTFVELVNVERIGEPDTDGGIGAVDGDYGVSLESARSIITLSRDLDNQRVRIDATSFANLKKRRIVVPKELVSGDASIVEINYGDAVISFMPLNLNTYTFTRVLRETYPYGVIDMDFEYTQSDALKISEIPRGLKNYSGVVDIKFAASSNESYLTMSEVYGEVYLAIPFNKTSDFERIKNTLAIYYYNTSTRSWQITQGSIDLVNGRVYTNIKKSGSYIVLGYR